jgi:hypothetical protein
MYKRLTKQRVPATDAAPQAKVALNGEILKWPADERPEIHGDQPAPPPARQRKR